MHSWCEGVEEWRGGENQNPPNIHIVNAMLFTEEKVL